MAFIEQRVTEMVQFYQGPVGLELGSGFLRCGLGPGPGSGFWDFVMNGRGVEIYLGVGARLSCC